MFFTDRAGVVGKTFLLQVLLETPPLTAGGGGGVRKFASILNSRGWFCRLYIFLGVRGASSKTIKTGLNCRQELKLNLYYSALSTSPSFLSGGRRGNEQICNKLPTLLTFK